MAISRNNLAAAVAGTLSVAMLAGCPNPGQPTVTPSGTAAPSTPAPSATVAPSAAPSGVTPTVVPSASTIGTTTVRGTVYDVDGKRLDGAKVTIKSLNPSNVFETTVDTADGAYVANGVPAGVIVSVTASKSAYAPREQKVTLLPLDKVTTQDPVNFGTADKSNVVYALTKAPEIIAVEPVDGATAVANDKMVVKMTISEALSSTERTEFANAIRVFWKEFGTINNVWKGNGDNLDAVSTTAAVVGHATINPTFTGDALTYTQGVAYAALDATGGSSSGTIPGGLVYADSTFLGESTTAATATWDAEGKVVTLTFNIPQYAAKSDETKYAISINKPADIKDQDGDTMSATPFRSSNANEAYFDYAVSKDSTKPSLVGARIFRNANDAAKGSELELTFSEPLAVYAGPNYVVSQAVVANNLPNFSIKMITAKTEADITKSNSDLRSSNVGTKINGFDQLTNSGTTVAVFNSTSTAISCVVDKVNPKILRIKGTNVTKLSTTDLNAIRVYVGAVIDPAGNESEDSDTNIKTATF